MKKKSILLTCICALMALAMFVGCDNAPVYPSFPTQAYIRPTGDFLEGQDFDASKFEVVATYLDGSSRTLSGVAISYTDNGDDGMSIGDTVSAIAGYDINNNPINTGLVTVSRVYPVSYLEVTTSESSFQLPADGSTALDPSDFTVVAHYINGQGEDATMTLSAAEYSATIAVNINVPDWDDLTEMPAVVTITLNDTMGDKTATLDVTATKAATIDPSEIRSIVGFSTSTTYSFAAFDYEELPEIDYSKVVFDVIYEDGTRAGKAGTASAVALEGLELSYVNEENDVVNPEFDNIDFSSNYDGAEESGIYLVAAYNGSPVTGEYTIPVEKTSIKVEYSGNGYPEGTVLADVDLDPSDFRVYLYLNEVAERIDDLAAEDFFFIGENVTMPAGGVYVSVNYNGVESVAGAFVKAGEPLPPTPVETLDSISIEIPAGFEYPAKMEEYNAVPTIAASDVIVEATYSVTLDDEPQDARTAVVTPNEVGFSTTNSSGAPTKASVDAFNGTDDLYIYAAYTEGEKTVYAYSESIKDSLVTAYATDLNVSFNYATMNADNTEPMVESAVNNFVVEAINDEGVVATLTDDDYTFIKDGNNDETVAIGSITVGKEAVDYQVYALVDVAEGVKDYITSDVVTVEAGLGWIDFDSVEEHLVFSLASGYDNRVGQIISGNADDYVVAVGEDGAEYIHEGYDGVPAVRIEDVAVVGNKRIEATGNEVLFTVSYVDETGEEQTVQIQSYDTGNTWTFEGVSGVVVDGENIGVLYDGSSFTGTVNPYATYVVDNFTLDESTYDVYGDAKPELVVQHNGSVYGEDTFDPGWNATGYSVKVTYTALTLDDETGLYVAAEDATEYVIDMVGRA